VRATLPVAPESIVALAIQAGRAILEVYASDFAVDFKADRSPLTAADRASHDVVVEGLRRLAPDVPILSEEGREIPYEERAAWPRLWLVDPLDGTKEFIKRNGEFTVNIALVEDHRTAWGVVHAPALGVTYWGGTGLGAFRQKGGEPPVAIQVAAAPKGAGLAVVRSRSHPSAEADAYLTGLNVAESVNIGSSLKFCLVAEGRAHLYPRFGPTMEWDTAAGQAVLEGAGGGVRELDGRRLRYNKPSLTNPVLLASATEPSR
jgi:3'(2'), 5'-bisphosphate nucleotidase